MSPRTDISIAALSEDPFEVLKMLRTSAPIVFIPEIGYWLVTRRDDVHAVLADETRFAPDTPSTRAEFFGDGDCVVFAEGAKHQKIRTILRQSLYSPAIKAELDRLVVQKATELIDALADRGEVDLYTEFCVPLSLRVLREIFGVGDIDEAVLLRWRSGLWAAGDPPSFIVGDEREMRMTFAAETEAELQEVLVPRLHELRHSTKPVVFSEMQSNEIDGRALSESEVYANVKQLLMALASPGEHVATVIRELLSHSAGVLSKPGDHAMLATAIQEVDRWWPISGVTTRRVKVECVVAGQTLESGARIACDMRSANRDEEWWTSPEQFDASRMERGTLTWGAGTHDCLGQRLVWRITPVAVSMLLTRLQGLELSPDRKAQYEGWPQLRPTSLWVRWRRKI